MTLSESPASEPDAKPSHRARRFGVRFSRKSKLIAAATAFTVLAVGGGTAYAVDGGTPPHPATLAVDANGFAHACENQFAPYELMRGNLRDACLAGYKPVLLATDKAKAVTGPIGPQGPAGPAGPPAGR